MFGFARRMASPSKSSRRHGFQRSDSEYLNSFSANAMSPYGSHCESSKKKHRRFCSTAKGIVGVFGSCLRPSLRKRDQNISQFKDISISSLATDHSQALSVYSFRSGTYGGNNLTNAPSSGFRTFTMSELSKATGNFNISNKIGQGGFGTVYKGKLKDGTRVAVKRAKKNIYDRHLSVEFQSEIRTLSSIEHHNLVRFLGYLEDQHERMVVVEYVPNGTLREHLDCVHGVVLDLSTRLDIAIDVAHAITYLHMYTDQPVIHRDIKSSNILITENFRAKVSDFGFSRIVPSVDVGATHVSTQVKGTAGYLDPEYLKTYQLTHKSDVYSFGVLLVEILTGRRPIEQKRELKERITVRWALRKFMEKDAILTLDPRLPRSPTASLLVERVLELAFQCAAPSRLERPSMKKAAEVLWTIRKDYRALLASTNREPTSEELARFAGVSSAPVSRHTTMSMSIKEETSAEFREEADRVSCYSH